MRTHPPLLVAALLLLGHAWLACAQAETKAVSVQHFKVRASAIDPKAAEHPELNFSFTKNGKPTDEQHAVVAPNIKPRGELVIWLMGYSEPLFTRLASYGLHAISVHYANGWFSKYGNQSPGSDGQLLGNIRIEAATARDASKLVNIPKPDSVQGRALSLVKHLATTDPKGGWDQFLNQDRSDLRWQKVTLAGASHGSTTAARMAKEIEVGRVVMLCGPRDQLESWQRLPSKTPSERFFGFSHVEDGGWKGDHYCRSWQLLGLAAHGGTVDVGTTTPPFNHSRRLISRANVGGNEGRAHSCVIPGGASPKDAEGVFLFESTWRYLFTHPTDKVGAAVAPEQDCELDLTGK
jgi:hypothetical protein